MNSDHAGESLQQPRASDHHRPHRSHGAGVMIVLLALVLYAAAGMAIAAAFLVFGVTRVLPEPAPVTLGARIVLFPGVPPDGERIAVFRDGAQIGALSNLCAHQHGPIGEGRIIDGCVTCPW